MCSALLGTSLLRFVKLNNSKGPNFHHNEMFVEPGRSMNVLLIIFINGCDFQMLVISVVEKQ